jgi:hypothetical protein
MTESLYYIFIDWSLVEINYPAYGTHYRSNLITF